MTDGRDILVLADQARSGELRSLPWPVAVVHRSDPYDVLEDLARREYRSVVLAHPLPDFDALVRAARRLQPAAGVYALCSPAEEPVLRSSPPEGLTDYFLFPPAQEDLARMSVPIAPTALAARGRPGAAAALSAREVADLIESAVSMPSLSDRVRQYVRDWTGRDVRWAQVPAGEQPAEALVLLDADPPQVLVCPEGRPLSAGQHAHLDALQSLLGPLAAQARRTEVLHHLAITDHLTGAYNRRYFYHLTDQLLARAKADRFRVTLLLYDIDDFKRYNDVYGHAGGDEILREIARLMRQVTREHDVVARIGGDEFTVLFWDAEAPRRPDSQHPQAAGELAGRFLQAVATHEFPALGPEARGVLTISGGLASFPWDGSTCRELLRRADAALRRAKASGKNAICIVGEPGSIQPRTQQ